MQELAHSETKADTAIDVREIASTDEFAALEAEWNDLVARMHRPLPFVTHEWFTIWLRHFREDRRLAIIVGREAGRLLFAFPLLETRRGAFRELRSITNAHSFRFHFLAEEGRETDAVDAALTYLARRPRGWDSLMFEETADDDRAQMLMDKSSARGWRTGRWQGEDCPHITVDTDWERFLASRKSKFRANLRRRRKRLAEEREVTFPVFNNADEQAVTDWFAIEAMAWKAENGSAILDTPAVENFYRDLARIAAERGWLRLSFLELAGHVKRDGEGYALAG